MMGLSPTPKVKQHTCFLVSKMLRMALMHQLDSMLGIKVK
jgi:hypothetical protein